MILRDFERHAASWRTGGREKTLSLALREGKSRIRDGWAGNAFAWEVHCINPLLAGGKKFERGWGFVCAKTLTAELNLPRPGAEFSASVALNDSCDLDRASREMRFELLSENGMLLASATVRYGEIGELRAALNGASRLLLRMTETGGRTVPADWLEPVVVYADGSRELPGERGNPPAAAKLEFTYGGEPFDPDRWEHSVTREDDRTFHHLWHSPDGKLELRVKARVHEEFHVIEYFPTLRTVSDSPTELVENFRSLVFRKTLYDLPHSGADAYREAAPLLQPELVLHRNFGSRATGTDFLASDVRLAGRHGMNEAVLDTDEGRSSAAWLPFFDIELSGDRRIGFAVGWSGAWRSRIAFLNEDTFEVTVGLRRTRFRMLPGEEIRQPSVALHYGVADRTAFRNEFRRFLVRHRLPRDSRGELLMPPVTMLFSGTQPNELLFQYLALAERRHLGVECFWVDAGWYGPDRPLAPDLHQTDWSTMVGDWRVNQLIHPGGLRPVSDALHRTGRKFLLWVEPSRADAHRPIVQEHPEYFIAANGDNRMLDLGSAAACDWAIETVSGLIEKEGVDCYREDFNFNTIPFWDAADASDRIGISESRFITGFYRFWETLRKRFPDLLIDNCASGGRRIDYETIALSIPLWRSDFQCFRGIPYLPEANQIHFDGLSGVLPFHSCGTRSGRLDEYELLSGMLGGLELDNLSRFRPEFSLESDAFNWDRLAKMLELARRVRSYLIGDYYRLTEHPEDFRNIFACELYDPGRRAGCVAVFRREAAPQTVWEGRLRAVDPAARYETETLSGEKRECSGAELAHWRFELPEPRSCQLLFFRQL